MEAAKLAEIEVIRLVNEPTAAAIAYGVHNEGKENVFIYDLGGGKILTPLCAFDLNFNNAPI